jgi:uncharacterized surface protein with fasciclin (FAS1) repeats
MTKRLFAILRYTSVVALMAGLFFVSSCSSDDDAGPVTFDGSIYAYISQDQFKQASSGNADTALDSLVMYLDKAQFADLKAALSSSTELTLFAPSNTAFKNLTALPGLTDPDKVNQDIIKAVLAYHIVPGKKTTADLTAGAKLNTMYSVNGTADFITVNSDGTTLLTGSSNDKIVISTPDQMTTNGVVHTTATVLIPNAIGSKLKNILGTLAATVLLGSDFTYMAYFIGYADTNWEDPTDTYSYLLADKTASLTLLAIPNPVFVGFYQQANATTAVPTAAQLTKFLTDSFTPAEANDVLENHVITGKYTVAGSAGTIKFENGGTVKAVSKKDLTFATGLSAGECSCSTGVVIIANGGASKVPIIVPDIAAQASIANGVLHVGGGIILN